MARWTTVDRGGPIRPTPPPPADTPLGYPADYERCLRLRDGRAVFVRPILPSDAAELGAAIRSADADTLHRRFLSGGPAVTPELLDNLTRVDYTTRFALIARDAETGIGVAIARYEPLEEGVAEIAVTVRPAWRRVGLATMLVELLAEAAADRGVHAFSVYYLADNRPVAALLMEAGGARRLIGQGVAESIIDLDRALIAEAHARLERDQRDYTGAGSARDPFDPGTVASHRPRPAPAGSGLTRPDPGGAGP